MDFNSWLLFASIITLASISPGPNVLAVVMHTIDAGARGALATIIGNLVALFTIALAAAVGVGALLHAAPNVFMAMKIAGGLYLAWMGIKMIKSTFNPMGPLGISSEKSTRTKSIEYSVRAMLISYSNPKSILFLSAVFPTFLDNSSTIAPQFVAMFLTIITIVLTIHGTYAFVALRMRDGLVGVGARKLMARVSGVSFLGFGLGFVYDAQK